MPKINQGSKKHTMVQVMCHVAAGPQWANSSKSGYRCVKCASTAHDRYHPPAKANR